MFINADWFLERMKLLLWILRLPSDRREICESKGLLLNFIDRLEQSTNEVMANIKESRRPVLAEVYKVARKEEALRNGEICKLSLPCIFPCPPPSCLTPLSPLL